MSKYKIDSKTRMKLQGQVILETMINFDNEFPVMLDGTRYQKLLKPVFEHLYIKELVAIDNGNYVPTEKGREIVVSYKAKYTEFARFYDVFNAVNLDIEEFSNEVFALNRYWDFDTDEEYDNYLNSPNFKDLRVQILDFKGLSPIEFVFMAHVNEGKVDLESDEWEYSLMSAKTFESVVKVCNTSYNEIDEEEAQEILPMIIEAGIDVTKNQKIREDELAEEEAEEEIIEDEEEIFEEEPVTEVVTYVEYVEEPYYELDYYDAYLDPFYVAPCFYDPYDYYW